MCCITLPCCEMLGVAASLKSLLKDPDATVRHKTTEVLGIIAGIYQSLKQVQ